MASITHMVGCHSVSFSVISLWLASVTIGHVAGGFIEEAERVHGLVSLTPQNSRKEKLPFTAVQTPNPKLWL